MLQSVSFDNLRIRGLLARRTGLSYARLEGQWYRAHEIFTADKSGWPGDWEGRTILALTLLAQATGREPAYLEEILRTTPQHLNKDGYFGPLADAGIADEQRLSGHSWFLRGLIEYCLWRNDNRIRDMLIRVIDNLYLPIKNHYAKYPVNVHQAERTKIWKLSHVQTKAKTHAMTIDTGCAFIALDGISQAYEYLREPTLKEMVEQMIDRFQQIDFVGMNVQTHATLSAVRGIIRYYKSEGNPSHLLLARRIFDLYKKEAWTENYANYNWFGRPRWTEACAVIDSYIVATWLWMLTGEPQYLEDAHLIYYNAIAHAHRASGGFGSERCLGSEFVFLRVTTYEVHWCCTMRGGEAWHKAYQFALMHDEGEIVFPNYHNLSAKIPLRQGSVEIKEITGYPYDGTVEIQVEASNVESEISIKFFVPSWTRGSKTTVKINGKRASVSYGKGFLTLRRRLRAGDRITLDLGIGLHTQDRVCKNNIPGYHTFRHGPMILWCDNPEVIRLSRDAQLIHEGMGCYRSAVTPGVANPGVVLTPINDPYTFTQPDSVKQVLFTADRSKTHG